MKLPTAGDIVGRGFVRVDAEDRLGDVLPEIRARQASHAAVFDGDELLGLVSLHAGGLPSRDRIFADLLPTPPLPVVGVDATLLEVGAALEAPGVDAAGVCRGGELLGVITRTDLLDGLLEQSRRQLRETAALQGRHERLRILGQCAAGVAHDLANCLMPLQCGLDLLAEQGALTPSQRQVLTMSRGAARDAGAILDRLRRFHREDGATAPAERVDLSVAARTARELVMPRRRPRAPQIQLEAGSDGGPVVRGNASELREVLVNLLCNAVDATEDGGEITVRARCEADRAVIEVSDTGCGMTPEQLEACGQPFFTTKGEAGTGLGLSVSRDIVERHGGSLRLHSEPSVGTTAVLRLPLAPADER